MKIFHSLLCFCFSATLFGQYSISGKVVNEDGESLIGASVFLKSSSYATISDDNGDFRINEIPQGNYVLKASYIAYQSFTSELEVNNDIDLGEIVLSGGIYGLEEIEIRSTWVDKDQPFAHTEISKEEIKKANLGQDVPYLLKWSPSVVVNSDAGAGVGYTGIRIRGTDPTRINVSINGIPLNDAESQGVFWVDLPDFLSSVDQIQIQRGVGTSANGAGAFGASINLSTNKANINAHAKVTAGYGSYNTKKLSFEAGTGLMNGSYSIDARLSRIDSDGYIDRASSDLESIYFSAAKVSKKSSLRLNVFSGSEVTYQAWNGLPIQLIDTDRTFNVTGTEKEGEPYDNEVDDYRQSHVQLLYNKVLSESWTFNGGLHYTKGKGFFNQYKAGQDLLDYGLTEASFESDLVRMRWLDNDFYGIVYGIEKKMAKSTLTIGGAMHNYQGRHFGEVTDTPGSQIEIPSGHTYYDNDAEKFDANFYTKMDYQLTNKINLYGDLQVRMVNYTFLGFNDALENIEQEDRLGFINPKVGVNFSLSEKSNVFASFAVGNKEPNRNDYTESTPSSRPKHETLNDLELGYSVAMNNVKIGINLYNMAYKNQLVNTGRINDVGASTRENVDESYRRGLELNMMMNLADIVTWSPSATFSQNKIKSYTSYVDSWDTGAQIAETFENTNLSFSPSVILSNVLTFHLGKIMYADLFEGLELGLMTKYVGKQYIDNTSIEQNALSAYTYTDVRLHWPLPLSFTKEASLTFQVNNLFNAKYVANAWIYRFKSNEYDPVPDDLYARSEGGGGYNLTGLFPQAERNFLLGLSIGF